MNINLNYNEVKYLKKIMQQKKYFGDEKAKGILDKLNSKEIHTGDKVKVIKILAPSDKYKKLLGKTGLVLKVDYYIDVQIDSIIYYFKREELKVVLSD